METRKEKDRIDVAVPQFKSESCESCFKPTEDIIEMSRKVERGGWKFSLPYMVCPECYGEIMAEKVWNNECDKSGKVTHI